MLRLPTLEDKLLQRLLLLTTVEGDGAGGGGSDNSDGDGDSGTGDSGSLLDHADKTGGDKSGEGGEGDSGEAAWFIAKGVPGTGEPPEGYQKDKYGTLVDQLKAHNEATKKLSQKDELRGAPEAYELALDEEVLALFPEDQRENANESEYGERLTTWAKKWDLPNQAVNELYSDFTKFEMEGTPDPKEEITKLGDNAGERLARVSQFIKNTVGKEQDLLNEALSITATANGVKLFETLMKSNRTTNVGDGDGDNTGQNLPTKEEIQAMLTAKDEHGQRKMHTDTKYAAQVKALYKQVYGEEQTVNKVVDFNMPSQ